MAKRFVDTSIFRKDFIRGLDAPYKLLWLYIINECDHAGLWDVELDIAAMRLGVQFNGDPAAKFGDKVIPVDGGKKWFIPSFITFQYGELKDENRAHGSVISLLKKFDLLDQDNQIKPLTSPLQGAMDMDKDKEKDMDKEKGAKKQSIAEIIPESWQGVAFLDLWNDYRQMRTKIRKPLTDRGEKESLKDLVRLSGGDWFKAETIALNSIKNSWQGFFAPKEDKGSVPTEGRYAHERITIRDKA